MSAQLQPPVTSTGAERLRGLLQALLRYGDARGRLFQIEAVEAGQHMRSTILLLMVLVGAAVGGWSLIVPAGIFWAAEHYSIPWVHLALSVGGLHLLVAIVTAVRLWLRLGRTRLFEESMNQLGKDRAWLAGNTPEN